MAYECIAWLKIVGVPLGLALNPVFNVVAKKYGKIVKLSELLEDDDDLSYVCVGILYGEGRKITDVVDIKWNGKSFRILVEEELSEWIPDCIEEEAGRWVNIVEVMGKKVDAVERKGRDSNEVLVNMEESGEKSGGLGNYGKK